MTEEEFRIKDLLTKIPVTTQEDVDRYCEAMKVIHPPLDINKETLRDRFAMAALTGLLSAEPDNEIYDLRVVTLRAYQVADAMLEARRKK